MNNPRCGACGAKMVKNGKTKAGTQRWRCMSRGASGVRRIDDSAKSLEAFLRRLLSKDAVADLGTSRATFWRRTAWAWRIWPIAPFTGEVHDVVFLDGIWLRRKAVVLVAAAGGHVVGWHLAQAECAAAWLPEYSSWCSKRDGLLKEYTIKDGKRVCTHERLRKARRGLNKLVRNGTLFAFVEMQQEHGGEWPSANNAAESVNARLGDMLRQHRGLPLPHRIKAIFWWCYMHAENPLPAAEILRTMPTDDDVDGLFAAASPKPDGNDGTPNEYGNGIVWSELHMPTERRR